MADSGGGTGAAGSGAAAGAGSSSLGAAATSAVPVDIGSVSVPLAVLLPQLDGYGARGRLAGAASARGAATATARALSTTGSDVTSLAETATRAEIDAHLARVLPGYNRQHEQAPDIAELARRVRAAADTTQSVTYDTFVRCVFDMCAASRATIAAEDAAAAGLAAAAPGT